MRNYTQIQKLNFTRVIKIYRPIVSQDSHCIQNLYTALQIEQYVQRINIFGYCVRFSLENKVMILETGMDFRETRYKYATL